MSKMRRRYHWNFWKFHCAPFHSFSQLPSWRQPFSWFLTLFNIYTCGWTSQKQITWYLGTYYFISWFSQWACFYDSSMFLCDSMVHIFQFWAFYEYIKIFLSILFGKRLFPIVCYYEEFYNKKFLQVLGMHVWNYLE